jgi:hypothetical protein
MNNLLEVYGKERNSTSSVDSAWYNIVNAFSIFIFFSHASFYLFSMCIRLAAAMENIQSNVDSRLQTRVRTGNSIFTLNLCALLIFRS